jgi:hypothetical protein
MSFTEGKWSQGGTSNDMQIFLGASEFNDVAGVATLASSAAGLFSQNVGSAAAATFFANIESLLRRTGEYAVAGSSQQQFGTAASVPGPSAVPGTSGPLALLPVIPPIPSSQMATLGNIQAGPIPKGMYVTAIDVIMEIDTVNAAAFTLGLTKTVFANGATPVVTSIVALGNNGLVKTYGTTGKPSVQTVTVSAPTMITDSDASILLNINLTAGTGGTAKFFGAVLHVTYNLN